MKTKIAINGFGRIGRAFLKLALDNKDVEVVAINDLGNLENLAYLLKYDTAQGKSSRDVSVDVGEGILKVDGIIIKVLKESEPKNLPWGKLGIDIVVESTGAFIKYEDAKMHLDAGAKRVVISAPAKGDDVPGVEAGTILMGINEDKLKTCLISSNASCTTNAGSPVLAIMRETIGIEKAMLNTTHGYTASQLIVDGPVKGNDFRKGRAGAQNIIPTSTGSAIATTKAITELDGKFDGIAVRVPVIAGSVADITFLASRDTTTKEVNEILRKAEKDKRWQGIFKTTDEPIVSSDIIGDTYASIADLQMTRVVDGNLVKILAWYDNEMGYSYSLLQHVIKMGKFIK